jgi:hypothetical protein
VIREAILDRSGNGATALPDRLEGAVFGHLVGGARSGGNGRGDGRPPDPTGLLATLDSLMTAGFDGDDQRRRLEAVPGRPGATVARALALPLVVRACEAPELVDLAARAARAAQAHAEAQVVGALHALVVRRLLDRERDRGRALAHARRDLRAALSRRGLPGSPETSEPSSALAALGALETRRDRTGAGGEAAAFWPAWDAFSGSSGFADAVARAEAAARASIPGDDSAAVGDVVAIAGGLAGAHWGVSAIPGAWRRTLPEQRVARALVDRLVETVAPGWEGRPWRTSTSNPLPLDRLDLAGTGIGAGSGGPGGQGAADAALAAAAGGVAITFLPGKRHVGFHTGAHWRDLDADAERLRQLGVDVLLLLVEDRELRRCRVTDIGEVLPAHGIDLVRFAVADPLLPRDGAAFRGTIVSLLARVRADESLAIACRGGFDRAGMAAGCLLREAGLGADEAIDRVHRARAGSLSLPDQQAYVREWPPGR